MKLPPLFLRKSGLPLTIIIGTAWIPIIHSPAESGLIKGSLWKACSVSAFMSYDFKFNVILFFLLIIGRDWEDDHIHSGLIDTCSHTIRNEAKISYYYR